MDGVFCAGCHRGLCVAETRRARVAVARPWGRAALGRPGTFLSWECGYGAGCAQGRLRAVALCVCARRECVCVCVFVSVHRLSTMLA